MTEKHITDRFLIFFYLHGKTFIAHNLLTMSLNIKLTLCFHLNEDIQRFLHYISTSTSTTTLKPLHVYTCLTCARVIFKQNIGSIPNGNLFLLVYTYGLCLIHLRRIYTSYHM